jgi:putative endonuclease
VADPWWLYMIECRGGGIYIGITRDVQKRYEQHRRGDGALYTRLHPPIRLLATQRFVSRHEAVQVEIALKRLQPKQKSQWAALIAAGVRVDLPLGGGLRRPRPHGGAQSQADSPVG